MPARAPDALLAAGLAAAIALAALAPASARATAAPPSAARLALSKLGDLSPFRTITADTLALVDKGDIPAARARIKDLETAWDKAEASLKPKDGATWKTVDDLIDAALTDLRIPNPKAAACAASLRTLMTKLDGLDQA